MGENTGTGEQHLGFGQDPDSGEVRNMTTIMPELERWDVQSYRNFILNHPRALGRTNEKGGAQDGEKKHMVVNTTRG